MAYIDINDTTGAGGGDATAANQLAEIALLTSIDNDTPPLGQETMANSSPVVIASDQSTVKVNLTNPSGVSVGTSGNPIYVVSSAVIPATSINAYHEVLSVASGITTTIVTYTVTAGHENVLERVSVSGENIALYTVLINGIPVDTQRTYFGGALNAEFQFMSTINYGTVLNAGDIVSVTVLHTRPYVANFEGRIQMSQVV
jgi:hypothetical protein